MQLPCRSTASSQNLSTLTDEHTRRLIAHVIFFILGGVIYSAVYNFVPGYLTLTLAVTAVATLMYIGTAFGGAIFPWTRKPCTTLTNCKYKLGNIPVITICGIIATLFSAWMLYYYLTVPGLGVMTPSRISETIMLSIFAIWVIYFFIRRTYLKRRGIDLELAFKEVPPV